MKKLQLILFFFVCLSAVTSDVIAQNGSVSIKLDRSEIKIGEQIEASLQLSFPVTGEYRFAVLKDTITKEIEIVELGKIDTTYEGNNLSTKVLSQKIILTGFDTGYHALPPIIFPGKTDTLKTEPLLISVMGVKVDPPQQSAQGEPEIEIKDIKNIRDAKFSIWEWIKMNALWIILVIVTAVAIWAYVKFLHPKLKNKNVTSLVQKKAIPPYEIAIRKLDKLKKQKLWQSGQVKLYHVLLSEIIREYIENQLSIPALESTTPEIIKILKEKSFSDEIIKELRGTLELSDLVKFAKHNPIGDENEDCLKKACHFIEVTKPKEVIPESKTEELSHV